uniref:Uncharacterized protein n=1 Tax=Rangifer tarandus platyrhynchus TaxID=3082113 RepID=A0ACB0E7T8_RANTA|nr:unnamed protein product [Rangifer tarandus platyrhynchus]
MRPLSNYSTSQPLSVISIRLGGCRSLAPRVKRSRTGEECAQWLGAGAGGLPPRRAGSALHTNRALASQRAGRTELNPANLCTSPGSAIPACASPTSRSARTCRARGGSGQLGCAVLYASVGERQGVVCSEPRGSPSGIYAPSRSQATRRGQENRPDFSNPVVRTQNSGPVEAAAPF